MERNFSKTPVFPATLKHLTMFIAHCFDKNLASSTVLTYISALSFLPKLGGYSDLTQHFIVTKTLRGYCNLKKAKDSRLPITPSILKGLIESLSHTGSSKFTSVMLKAMYLLAFNAFLRIGEITGPMPPKGNSLALGNIKFIFDRTNTPSAVEIHMSQLKHSSVKHITVLLVQSNELPGNMCPVKDLWDYLQIRGHETKKRTTSIFIYE